MNINSFSERSPFNVYTFGLVAIIGYLGYLAIKWILKKSESHKKIDEVAKRIIDHPVLPLINPKPSPIKKEIPVSKSIECGTIDLKDAQYPNGITQYFYPPNPNPPQACSFHAATFVLYMAANLQATIDAFRSKNLKYLIDMRKEIIDRGLMTYAEGLKSGMPAEAIFPEDLAKYTQNSKTFDCLKLKESQDTLNLGFDDELVSVNEELDNKLFKTVNGQKTFAVVQADGQSFALFAINDQQAFLFDSHKSWFRLVSKQEAVNYIEHDILHLEINSHQSVDFYCGSI